MFAGIDAAMASSSVAPDSIIPFASAARALLANEGFRGLSLRAVAQSAGATLNALSYHVGDKASLMGHVIELELLERRAVHARWLLRAEALRPIDDGTLARLISAYLDEAMASRRDSALAAGELLLAAMRDPHSFPRLAMIFDEERTFWQQMARDRPAPQMLGRAVAAYCQDEMPFTVALGDNPDYRLLRDATVMRLAEGFSGNGTGLALRFDALVEAMGKISGQAAKPMNLEEGSKRAIMAGYAADVLADLGIAAVTHRVVATHAGVPNSSVAHHFRTRDDLIQAGIEGLYARMQDDVSRLRANSRDLQRDSGGMTVLRNTHMIALEAARNPHFRPFAADMRRQRAVNVRDVFAHRIAGSTGLDGAAVQAVVIALVGMMFADEAGDDATLPTTEAKLDWIAALRTASTPHGQSIQPSS